MSAPRHGSILFAVLVYVLGIAVGYAGGGGPGSKEYVEQLASMVRELLALGPLGTYVAIFANNAAVTIAAVLGGFLLFTPILILFVNGVVLGALLAYTSTLYSMPEVLALILPHGVFEIPAFILACGIGVDIAARVLERGFRDTLARLDAYMSAYRIVLLLLAIAAAIETLLIYSRM